MENIFEVTPIQKLNMKINENKLFVKRDDLLPFSFGGNKVRKAILFFNDLEDKKKDSVVTYGSSSSNHCRIVANMAALKDIKCFIISPLDKNKETFNKQFMDFFGAKLVTCNLPEVKETISNTLRELKAEGYDPYFIQGGGHGFLGTQAYVDAYKEIRDFELDKELSFDYIFHTSGTGTTQAGLICGKLLNQDSKTIVGISNARKNPRGGEIVFNSVNSYLKKKGYEGVSKKEINFIDDYVSGGYGKSNFEITKIIKDTMINEGIPLDVTYTAKGFLGMEKYIKKENIVGKNVLFIHTGGTPIFFDNLEDMKHG